MIVTGASVSSYLPQATRLRLDRARHGARNSARIGVRSLRAQLNAVLPGDRPLPQFVIVGAQRCGTTSLYRDLSGHPQVREPLGKELQYFTLFHRRSLDWYRGHFPVLEPGQQTFEASPYYLFHPHAAARMGAALPTTRFVVLVRDPVERAFSHYLHTLRTGDEPLGFEEAVAAEPQRMRRAEERGLDSAAGHDLLRQYSYLGRGMYGEQLNRMLSVIPLERVHVMRSEELHVDPDRHFAGLLEFLGLEPFTPDRFARHSRRRPGQRTAIDPVVRDMLRERFTDDGRLLQRMLGWNELW